MNRLLPAMKTDISVQARNNLYVVSVVSGLIAAVALSQLAGPDNLYAAMPATVLLVTGGLAMLYVMGLIIFEKDEGTLNAVFVTPLRIPEYLWSKILTLSALALFETAIAVGGAMLIIAITETVQVPRVVMLLAGTLAIGTIYTLAGIIVVTPYEKITSALVPMSAIGAVLQAPALYFLGWVESQALLFIPTAAPTMLLRGAFVPLHSWEWAYSIAVTIAAIGVLTLWAYRAFDRHIVMKAG